MLLETSRFQVWDFILKTLTLKSGLGFQSKRLGTCTPINRASAILLASFTVSRKGACGSQFDLPAVTQAAGNRPLTFSSARTLCESSAPEISHISHNFKSSCVYK